MEGYKDPFNRRTYPWNKLNKKQQDALLYFRRIARLRTEDPVYVDVGELYGSYVCNKVSDDGIKPPLTDHLILGGNTGGNRRIGIMPYSVAFVVF